MDFFRKIGLILLFLFLVFAAAVVWVIPSLMKDMPNRKILNRVEEQVPVYALEIRHVTVDVSSIDQYKEMGMTSDQIREMEDLNDAILFRLVFLDGSGRCIPKGCGMIPYLASMGDKICGVPQSFRVVAVTLNPTNAALEAGTKTKILYTKFVRAIGANDCEEGPLFKFEDESGPLDFLKDIVGKTQEVLKNLPDCTIGVWSGGQYTESQCMADPYYATETLIGIGPVPQATGMDSLYIVTATAYSLELHSIADLPSMGALGPVFSDSKALSPADLKNIQIYLTQADKKALISNP